MLVCYRNTLWTENVPGGRFNCDVSKEQVEGELVFVPDTCAPVTTGGEVGSVSVQ